MTTDVPRTAGNENVASGLARIALSLEETVTRNQECVEKGHVSVPGKTVPTVYRGTYWAYETCGRCKEYYDRPMTHEEIKAFREQLQQPTMPKY